MSRNASSRTGATALSILLAALLFSTASAAAQTAGELIYSVNRTPEPLFEAPRGADVITIEEIWRKNARTLPELLMQEAGIFLEQLNYGGGSPIIRGLKGKHVLILIDGAKINSATYPYGPVEFLNTIDLNIVERVEIVRGVGSVLASAMGGVINIITKKNLGPDYSGDIGAAGFGRYSSADNATTGHAEVFSGSDRHRILGSATYRRTKDLHAGAAIGDQRAPAGMGYDELAAQVSAEFDVGELSSISAAFRLMDEPDVPGEVLMTTGFIFGHTIDSRRLQQGMLRFQNLAGVKPFDFVQLTTHWNRQDNDVRLIFPVIPGLTSESFQLETDDYQNALELNLELGTFFGNTHRLLYGIDLSTEKIRSSQHGLMDADTILVPARFPDGASYHSAAAYIQDRMRIGNVATFTLGARFNSAWIRGVRELDYGTGGILSVDIDKQESDVTGLANLMVHATPNLNLIASVARGFRPPNVEDVGVFAVEQTGVEIPNPSVTSERIMSYEFGLRYSDRLFSGSAFWFLNDMSDLIQQANGTFFGMDFFDVNGNGVRDIEDLPILTRVNLGEASISGFEATAELTPHRSVVVFGNVTYMRGDDNINDVPLSGMPPAFGVAAIRWAPTSHLGPWIEANSHFAASQTRLSPADSLNGRIGAGGTDGFVVFNVRGGLTPARGLRVNVGLENITDEVYKYHGSGFFRPGFQVVVGAEYRLGR